MSTPTIEPGLLLIAGVGLTDGVFGQSVVLILDADPSGALGVVLNRLSGFELQAALPQWAPLASYPDALFDGGPVSQEGAICLASPLRQQEEPPGWRPVFERVGLLHLDTPVEIAHGAYADLRVFAGYAGWGPGSSTPSSRGTCGTRFPAARATCSTLILRHCGAAFSVVRAEN